MTNRIINYIEFLRKNYGFNITIHEKTGRILRSISELIEYDIHSNPYCLCVKSNRELWDVCIEKQTKVYQKAKSCEIFYGSCYAGMEEYVLPIKSDDEVVGFVSVSGYCRDVAKAKKKISALVDKYRLDGNGLEGIYEKNVSFDVPDAETVKTLVEPLCSMLELVYLKSAEYINIENMNAEANYIYGHALAYIRKNYTTKITLDRLSEMCHCSNSYISHLFKKNSGKSINAYTNELRVREAAKLLANTTLSVKEISMRTGFFDSNYFTNTFKKIMGISPKEYRKSNRTE